MTGPCSSAAPAGAAGTAHPCKLPSENISCPPPPPPPMLIKTPTRDNPPAFCVNCVFSSSKKMILYTFTDRTEVLGTQNRMGYRDLAKTT